MRWSVMITEYEYIDLLLLVEIVTLIVFYRHWINYNSNTSIRVQSEYNISYLHLMWCIDILYFKFTNKYKNWIQNIFINNFNHSYLHF